MSEELKALCKDAGADYEVVRKRVSRGWLVEKALSEPVRPRKPNNEENIKKLYEQMLDKFWWEIKDDRDWLHARPTYSTFRRRLVEENMTPEEAILCPSMQGKHFAGKRLEKLEEFEGGKFLPVENHRHQISSERAKEVSRESRQKANARRRALADPDPEVRRAAEERRRKQE
ncbi:hypothetical protein NG895_04170 [Aeoliella sp. ICT_H6.2]|uniref:Uncharacterized protein n=1 Tax=Aeoliella straminimaris TaxID=2954799 RepID=A0A9X2JFA1_9BACT|nr:hypothetical protein [Aeoliella straminimaris]MCO6043092.1 hypothetical protein [Aeoliella straminimaris]